MKFAYDFAKPYDEILMMIIFQKNDKLSIAQIIIIINRTH